MSYDLKMLLGYIDTYFEFYSNNPVSSVKIAFELYAWLTVNFMLGFISCDDLTKALNYVNIQVAKREESNHGI